jgi:hypothetical protein
VNLLYVWPHNPNYLAISIIGNNALALIPMGEFPVKSQFFAENRELSPDPGDHALRFHMGRAAMHHLEVVPVAALRRAINRRDRKPGRFEQAVSVGRIEGVAAM